MTTDRELLGLAAKAADMPVEWDTLCEVGRRRECMIYLSHAKEWNPLTDDGDALRLAVRLRITPNIDSNLTEAEWANQGAGGFIAEAHIDDPYAATRRAITRAAAEIARATAAQRG